MALELNTSTLKCGYASGAVSTIFSLQQAMNALGRPPGSTATGTVGDRFAEHAIKVTCGAGRTHALSVLIGDVYVDLVTGAGSDVYSFTPLASAKSSAAIPLFGRWRDIRVTFSATHADNAIVWESRPSGLAV